MDRFHIADNLIRCRHTLRELLESGDFEPATDIIEHLADLVDDEEAPREAARWRFRFELAAAYAQAA